MVDPVASITISAETVTVGAVVSSTVTVKLPVAVLFAVSVTLQFTGVIPSAKVLLDAGAQPDGNMPSTVSLALEL